MSNSLFITFEGIDGCGKTTQIKLLSDYLKSKNFKVLVTKEPGGSDFGREVERIFKNKEFDIPPMCELLMMYADRYYHINRVIKPSLKNGFFVISDRFQDSTIAYQGYGGGVNIEILKKIAIDCGIDLKPDITFLIDISPEEARKRCDFIDRMEEKNVDFFKRVREGYLKISEEEPDRFFLIDGNSEIHEIHNLIVKTLERFLP